jgi:hypothetical protein
LISIVYCNIGKVWDIRRITGHSLFAVSSELLQERRVKAVALTGGKKPKNGVAGYVILAIWISLFASTAKK